MYFIYNVDTMCKIQPSYTNKSKKVFVACYVTNGFRLLSQISIH